LRVRDDGLRCRSVCALMACTACTVGACPAAGAGLSSSSSPSSSSSSSSSSTSSTSSFCARPRISVLHPQRPSAPPAPPTAVGRSRGRASTSAMATTLGLRTRVRGDRTKRVGEHWDPHDRSFVGINPDSVCTCATWRRRGHTSQVVRARCDTALRSMVSPLGRRRVSVRISHLPRCCFVASKCTQPFSVSPEHHARKRTVVSKGEDKWRRAATHARTAAALQRKVQLGHALVPCGLSASDNHANAGAGTGTQAIAVP
jgi:hypothetical protein